MHLTSLRYLRTLLAEVPVILLILCHMDNNTIELFCLVEGDTTVFPVTIAIDDHVSSLKKLVHQNGVDNMKIPVLPKDLTLWKLNEPVLIKPIRSLVSRLPSQRRDLSRFAVELEEPTDELSVYFPEVPMKGHLHIIVQVPPAAIYINRNGVRVYCAETKQVEVDVSKNNGERRAWVRVF